MPFNERVKQFGCGVLFAGWFLLWFAAWFGPGQALLGAAEAKAALPGVALLGAARAASPQAAPGEEPFPEDIEEAVWDDRDKEERGCNSSSVSFDGSLTNDNRRTTGLVLSQGGYLPPVQQSLFVGRIENIRCERIHLEGSVWYSLHDVSAFKEKRFQGRAIYEPFSDVSIYGGLAYYDNAAGLFTATSSYLIGGVEYPTFWGVRFSADYLRDIRENGDWLTVMLTKRYRLGATESGAVFSYLHGFGATGTRSLPGDIDTPSMTGIPSVFYRALLEIEDGPVVWYAEASPHVSFVSRATGVPKRHFRIAVGLRMSFP